MRHYYNRFLFLMVLLLSAVSAIAGPRSVEQARQAVLQLSRTQHYAKAKAEGGRAVTGSPRLVFSKPRGASAAGEAYYYVFSTGKGNGYTLVSGDDRMPAIIGYTERGDYDESLMPENFRNFMQAYQDMMDNLTDKQAADIAAWQAQRTSHAAVEPIMEEKWNQEEPYNNLCPVINGYKTLSGCVATSMAQILHHIGKSHHITLTNTIQDYTTFRYLFSMPAIPAGDHYDWANMLDVYDGTETEAQGAAVARLMLDVGCAVHMDYTPNFSGAYASSQIFSKYFGMDPELIRQTYRGLYDFAQWDGILYGEMAAHRPVYYDGQSTGGGHAFVIHGYSDGLYYVNWGWGGYCDGYFDVTILNPQSSSGSGASSSGDGYSTDNCMIVGIQPDNGIEDPLPYSAFSCKAFDNGRVSDLGVRDREVTGRVSVDVYNLNTKKYTRQIGVGYMDDAGNIVPAGVHTSPVTLDEFPEYANRISYMSYRFGISFPASEGRVYELFMIESEDGTHWTAMEGRKNNAVVKVEGGAATLVEKAAELTATVALNKESGGYCNMMNTIDITISNSGDMEYNDVARVRVNSNESMPYYDILTQGITVEKGGSMTLTLSYMPPTAGTYHFWVLDSQENLIGKGSVTFREAEAPVLSFVSIKCANASGERIYTQCVGYEMEMDKVNDTKADFTFEVRNDGGFYEGDFLLYNDFNSEDGSFRREVVRLRVPGNTTSRFTFTVEGKAGDIVGCSLANMDYEIAPLQVPNSHRVKTPEGEWSYDYEDAEICYLAGSSVGIAGTVADTAGKKVVYNMNGQRMNAPRKGINIINGRKVIVR